MHFSFQEHFNGPCSKCNDYSTMLRVCTNSAVQAGLLVKTGENSFDLTPHTTDELLETIILRIKSIGICADCVINNGLKEDVVMMKNIKRLYDIAKALNYLSMFSFSMKQIEREIEEFKNKKNQLRFYNMYYHFVKETYPEIMKWLKNDLVRISAPPCWQVLLKIVSIMTQAAQSLFLKSAERELQISKEKLRDSKGNSEWQKTVDKLENFRDFLEINHVDAEIQPIDMWNFFVLCTTEELDKVTAIINRNLKIQGKSSRETLKEVYYLTRDVRKTLPFQIPERFAGFIDRFIRVLVGENLDEEQALEIQSTT